MLSLIKKIKNIHWHVILPTCFFFGGFLWDAITIGSNVAMLDLWTFAAYLLGAGLLIFGISRPKFILLDESSLARPLRWVVQKGVPYMALQFLFGSLLSALFILYFKSAGHGLAWLITVCLGLLLVANEFWESEYRRFTLSWAMFGLCTILLFNFALPFLLGSVHAAWFYLSTVCGASLAFWLYKKSPNHMGSIFPVWVIAGLLMFAYWADAIPPVPLVAKETAVGYHIVKVPQGYQITAQAAPWWQFWHANTTVMQASQKVVCFSSIFAPVGLHAKLYHDWQYHLKTGWRSVSRAGFTMSGGRQDGYRGYTYKTNLQAGDWRVLVTTEQQKTIAVQEFTVKNGQPEYINLMY